MQVGRDLSRSKNFDDLSRDLGISKASAEVYAIDCLAAEKPLDHDLMAHYLDISLDDFSEIKEAILHNEDNKLRSIRDELQSRYSYNQIRFVLACLIRDLELYS